MTTTILLLTVGGSHQPIIAAINALKPNYVCFLCSADTPGTRAKGSYTQIEGQDNVIIAKYGDKEPTLPNIPAQLGLATDAYAVVKLPADELDSAVEAITQAINTCRSQFPDARLVADYTGGTKTMSAALVVAVLEAGDVTLNMVQGTRSDLTKVNDGTEYSTVASAERVTLRRRMAPYLGAWQRFAYDEAASGLKSLSAPQDAKLRGEWQLARDLSEGFSAWDRFDHHEASRKLQPYKMRLGATLGLHYTFLDMLCGDATDTRREPARLWDLWLNARRRASQGRYDDAVARVYRLLEWSAQWLLRTRAGINTSDLGDLAVPEDIGVTTNREGKRMIALFAAWQLASYRLGGEIGQFFEQEKDNMLNHLKARNHSILAHGYAPVDQAMWQAFAGWIEQALLPVLQDAAVKEGMRLVPPQLPADGQVWLNKEQA